MFEFERKNAEPDRWPDPDKDRRRLSALVVEQLGRQRFFITPEAQEVVATLAERLVDIKKDYPGVLGLCLHGSLVKGYWIHNSDVDGYLYVETEERGFKATKMLEDIHSRLSELSGSHFNLKDVGVLSINEGIIREQIRGGDPIIMGFFLYAIGDGINKYRELILRLLENMGPDGELEWRLTMQDLWEFENKGFSREFALSRLRFYPTTISEGRSYFLDQEAQV